MKPANNQRKRQTHGFGVIGARVSFAIAIINQHELDETKQNNSKNTVEERKKIETF